MAAPLRASWVRKPIRLLTSASPKPRELQRAMMIAMRMSRL
jgi:hypothetical protein